MATFLTDVSGADVPKDLKKEIEHLESVFTVDRAKLKQITDHFVTELDKGMMAQGWWLTKNTKLTLASPGLSVEGGSIVSWEG